MLGSNIAINSAMMAITTSNSISVNPPSTLRSGNGLAAAAAEDGSLKLWRTDPPRLLIIVLPFLYECILYIVTGTLEKNHHFVLNIHHFWRAICPLPTSFLVGSKRELLLKYPAKLIMVIVRFPRL
jgi:hypothetical protein